MGLNFIKRITQIRNLMTLMLRKHEDDRGIQVAQFLENNLYQNPKYANSKRLNKHEYQVFSQYGEDGIIQEIFNRIGSTNQYFIEFGVQDGLECNTLNLLYKGWKGLWIEGSPQYADKIRATFNDMIGHGQLTIKNEFITAENIESIFNSAGAPAELDLLSIDIDYNDYYIWQAITNFNPRVVIVEYNATFRPDTEFIVKYKSDTSGDGSSYFGASLLSFQQLADKKGYCLVSCSFAGTNAFFVRKDLIGDLFEAPFTAENHYEPTRYYLYYKAGHPKNHIPG
ncbi:hypothetical protein [Mucilaginibacter boryungensis]|uniref:Methyltransferase FkbM domain-containing protein n=1 Tax=Mucilaginibacter boryungensis TaxID=768480 RepID=A0ABR9XCT8_9SPHI|nr:hypothetical protein [Mucilaginibacter boryungensis]MBE9664869.1 hypothetical protein [Mucilaginibacter boryungensis]